MFEITPIIFQLSNGIRVVYQKTDAFVAHMGVVIQAGSRYEQPEEEGLAHFLEHCIFKGTTKRKAFDIFTDLDSVGGELNAYTTKEEICIHASFRKNHFSIASELLSDILQNASFPEDEIEKEKEVVLDEIISYLDSPAERIYDDFEALIFKGHSLGYNTLGTKKQSILLHERTCSTTCNVILHRPILLFHLWAALPLTTLKKNWKTILVTCRQESLSCSILNFLPSRLLN